MKPYLLLMVLVLLCGSLIAQNVLKVQSGITLKTAGGAVITIQDMDLENDGVINQLPGEGKFIISGTQNNFISGSTMPLFDIVDLGKTGTAKMTLNRNISIGSSLNFLSGYIDLNNNNILLQPSAILFAEYENSRIVGDNGGFVEITQTLNAPSSSNPGNLGAIITSTQNLGSTTIRRGHVYHSIGANQSVKRYFDISPVNNTSLNATLRFNYFDGELNLLDENVATLYRSTDNINWTEIGADSRSNTTNYIEKSGIASFSRWTLFNPSGALPVVFTSINGRCDNGKFVISWKTAQERNSSRFDIQRNINGGNWTVIGSVSAAGFSNVEKTYSYTDGNPVANSLYRIAQYDIDGSIKYTSILRSSCDNKEGIQVWPNPVADVAWINITTGSAVQATIRLYDAKGSLLHISKRSLMPGTNQLSVSVEKFAKGIYELKIEWGPDHIKTVRLVKF